MRNLFFALLTGLFLFVGTPQAMAMEFTVNDTTMFKATNDGDGGSGDKYSTTVSSTGEKLVFNRYFQDSTYAYVKLETRDGQQDLMSFLVPSGKTLKVTKIDGKNPSRSFWFVALQHKDTRRIDGTLKDIDFTDYFWLIGPYKGGYVSFVTSDTLQMYGINIPTDAIVYPHSSNIPDVLNLEISRLYTEHVMTFGWAGLAWDEDAQWFGIAKNNFE